MHPGANRLLIIMPETSFRCFFEQRALDRSTGRRWPAAILSSLLISVAVAVSHPVAAEPLNTQQQLALDIYKELVEIDTTTATGDTGQAADAMASRLRAAGFS